MVLACEHLAAPRPFIRFDLLLPGVIGSTNDDSVGPSASAQSLRRKRPVLTFRATFPCGRLSSSEVPEFPVVSVIGSGPKRVARRAPRSLAFEPREHVALLPKYSAFRPRLRCRHMLSSRRERAA